MLRIMSSSLGNVYQKKLTIKGCNPILITTVTYVLLTACCIPFIWLYGVYKPQPDFYIYAIVVGFLGALGNGFLVKAFKNGQLSVLGPLNSYKSVIGLFLGILILKEMPNIYGLIGMLLILFGSYFIFDTLIEKFSLALFKNKEIQYRFLSLIFCAVEAIFIKKTILLSSVWDAFIAWCFFGAVFSLILLTFEKIDFEKELSVLKSRNLAFFINIVICIGIMQFTTNYLFARMNVAYALAIFQLGAIVSIFLGQRFFAEKDIFKKILGSLIMIAGAVLIVLYN